MIITVKSYHLEDLPKNSRMLNPDSQQTKRFMLKLNNWTGAYKNLVKEVQKVYGSSLNDLNSFKIYWIDDEKEMVSMSTDNEFQTAMMYGTNSIRIFIFDPKINKDVQVTINFDKHLQKHPGITCSGCKTPILGIRYICKTCEDYDLCEACKNKKIHSHHPFALMPSKFGFPVCNECDKEITTTYCCQECTDKKVGQINSALANERFKKGKPVRYEHISWIVCDDCRLRNHNGHPFVTESVLELNKQQQELINELMNAKKNGEERKVYPGIKCSSCSKDGVRFKSTSFKYERVFLCEQCLTEGVFKNLLSLIKLTDADYDVLIKEERKKQKIASMYGTYASRNIPHMKTAFDTNKVYGRVPLGIQQRHSPPNYDGIPQIKPPSAFVGYPQNIQNSAFGHASNGPVQGFAQSAGFKPPHNRVMPYI